MARRCASIHAPSRSRTRPESPGATAAAARGSRTTARVVASTTAPASALDASPTSLAAISFIAGTNSASVVRLVALASNAERERAPEARAGWAATGGRLLERSARTPSAISARPKTTSSTALCPEASCSGVDAPVATAIAATTRSGSAAPTASAAPRPAASVPRASLAGASAGAGSPRRRARAGGSGRAARRTAA